MAIVRLIVRVFLGLFRRRAGLFEVWDTSAISNHFLLFKQKLQKGDITLVIPEGVSHEISVGRRNNEICKEIYKFIEGNVRNPNLVVAVASDAIRAWAVDEQVVYTAEQYYNKGYRVKLVTCDRDQNFKATLKRLDTELMPVPVIKKSNVVKNNWIKKNEITFMEPAFNSGKEESNYEERQKSELELPAKMVGKQCYIEFDKELSVYDQKGERRIARSSWILPR